MDKETRKYQGRLMGKMWKKDNKILEDGQEVVYQDVVHILSHRAGMMYVRNEEKTVYKLLGATVPLDEIKFA